MNGVEEKTNASLTICTSEPGWVAELTKAYLNRDRVILLDDANVGIDPANQSLLTMARRGKLSPRELTAVLISAGMTVFGAAMIILAFVDPEPTSKLGLMVGGGTVALLGGGFSAIHILTNRKPPKVRVSPRGFEIGWE
jgi:hypothetical protein